MVNYNDPILALPKLIDRRQLLVNTQYSIRVNMLYYSLLNYILESIKLGKSDLIIWMDGKYNEKTERWLPGMERTIKVLLERQNMTVETINADEGKYKVSW